MSAVAFFGTLAGGGTLPAPGNRAVLELGSTAYYAASNTTAMDVSDNDPFTVAFRMVTPTTTAPAAMRSIVSKKVAANLEKGWRVSWTTSGKIGVAIADGTLSNSYTTNNSVGAGYKSVVCVWSGSAWTVYFDGVSQALTVVHNDAVTGATDNDQPVRFGRMRDDTASYEGWLFDVAMWYNVALSASDVTEYGSVSDLADRTDLREMTVPPHYYVPIVDTDTDGNGTGTLADYGTSDLGMTSVVTDGTEILTGEGSWATGYSVSFDGTTEWLTTPVVLPTGAWSIAFWYYHTGTNSIIGVGNWDSAGSTTILANVSGELRVRMKDSGTGDCSVITSSTPFPSTSAWYHVLVTHDGTGNASGVRAYVNGSAVTFTTTTDTMGSNVAGVIKLGYLLVSSPTARACEYAVWTTDVNASQSTIYNGGTRANRLGISPAPDLMYLPILSTDVAGKEDGHFYDLKNTIMYRADASTDNDLENVSP